MHQPLLTITPQFITQQMNPTQRLTTNQNFLYRLQSTCTHTHTNTPIHFASVFKNYLCNLAASTQTHTHTLKTHTPFILSATILLTDSSCNISTQPHNSSRIMLFKQSMVYSQRPQPLLSLLSDLSMKFYFTAGENL